ncbi:BNR repeat protein [Propionibacteriaceae bacterium ES.041]|uniref:exo-alpha-sialidase n=1 Tax=Enemella evansiae TaxID=2016499 RepID=UPI000B968261|nr:exo-alpha-sialidase [Enemella evansiae]OYO02314.1 hypothetical protein CGZ96_02950 [Enemella evansiae]PFG67028.1 BNR repeat protein [Propionibacteriaceae bacterium ES.041]
MAHRSETSIRLLAAGAGALASALVVSAVAGGTPNAPGSSPSAAQGGSLPLVGDRMPTGAGAAVDQPAYGTGSHWNAFNWGPGNPAAVPASASFPIVGPDGRTEKQVTLSTQAQPDVGSAKSIINSSNSADSGKSFLTTERNYPVTALNEIRLRDGSYLAIDFIPQWGDAARSFTNLKVRTSKDGQKWELTDAPVTMPPEYQLGPMSEGLRVHRRVMELPDGTLMVPIYTVFKGTNKQRSAILQSSDGGRSWSLRSVIPATNAVGTNEVGWSWTSDGRLLSVIRTTDSPVTKLVYSYSDDQGRSWSEVQELIGPDGVVVRGIYPDLLLQPNGTLLLTTGRPDVRMLASFDGTGRSWQIQDTVFANYPSTGNNGRYDGTSGNNTMESVGANRSVLFYDQCHVWGCGAYNEQFGVSATYVGAVTPGGTGRIDVLSRLLDKTATVSGRFTKPDKKFPTVRPEGAFDGLSDRDAVAKLDNRGGELVLALDRSYPINRIGLMLGHGEPQSATVQFSIDGQQWSAPVLDAVNRSDRALRYTDLPAPQEARYVKVTGAPGVETVLTELELYTADADTFENELPFAIPRGWTDANKTWVTDVPNDPAYAEFGGSHSRTALRLFDKWTDDNARISRPFAPSPRVQTSMQFGGSDYRAMFTFGVRGTGVDGARADAWMFRLVQGKPASLQAWNGSAWVEVGKLAEALPTRTYLPLSMDLTADRATVTIGTQTFTTAARAGAATTMSSLDLSTGDPAQYGGFYLIDDVVIRPGS